MNSKINENWFSVIKLVISMLISVSSILSCPLQHTHLSPMSHFTLNLPLLCPWPWFSPCQLSPWLSTLGSSGCVHQDSSPGGTGWPGCLLWLWLGKAQWKTSRFHSTDFQRKRENDNLVLFLLSSCNFSENVWEIIFIYIFFFKFNCSRIAVLQLAVELLR